jgi:hypothetical protein
MVREVKRLGFTTLLFRMTDIMMECRVTAPSIGTKKQSPTPHRCIASMID